MAYGLYKGFSFKFETSQIPTIVRHGFFYTLVGGVVFIEGVVIQGFKNIPALILHLAAVVPYYLAIQEVLKVGDTFQSQPQAYLTPSQYYFLAGIILNILGFVANRVRRQAVITRTGEVRT